jgi:hypothetical protein
MGPSGQCYKTFLRNYVAIGITSVKILGKYAASCVNYGRKKSDEYCTLNAEPYRCLPSHEQQCWQHTFNTSC